MVPFQDIQLFSDLLAAGSLTEADVVSVLGQVAVLLLIWGERLDMNHRDLKTNNVILCAGEGLEVAWGDRLLCVGGRWSVKLVDFGFACTGSGRRTLVGATEFFPITDPCPKTGRDLFQLLTVMYMCESFRGAMSERMAGLFKKWLTIPGRDYLKFLENMGERGLDWVYFLLGSQSFAAPSCEPSAVLADLAAAYPDIVRG
jgi:serine/threonine protein kinase